MHWVTRGPAGFLRVHTTDYLTVVLHTNFAPTSIRAWRCTGPPPSRLGPLPCSESPTFVYCLLCLLLSIVYSQTGWQIQGSSECDRGAGRGAGSEAGRETGRKIGRWPGGCRGEDGWSGMRVDWRRGACTRFVGRSCLQYILNISYALYEQWKNIGKHSKK